MQEFAREAAERRRSARRANVGCQPEIGDAHAPHYPRPFESHQLQFITCCNYRHSEGNPRKRGLAASPKLRSQGINKVVRWPGATKEQLNGLARRKVTSGSAKGCNRIAGHEEIEGQEPTSAGRRKFDFVANEGAVQRIAELLNQRVLKHGRPLSAQVV